MHADFAEIGRLLTELEQAFIDEFQRCHGHDPRPAGITLTVQ